MLQDISISNKCCSFRLSIHSHKKKIKQTVFNIDKNNTKKFLEHQIRIL